MAPEILPKVLGRQFEVGVKRGMYVFHVTINYFILCPCLLREVYTKGYYRKYTTSYHSVASIIIDFLVYVLLLSFLLSAPQRTKSYIAPILQYK